MVPGTYVTSSMSEEKKNPLGGFIKLFNADPETSIALLKNSLTALEYQSLSSELQHVGEHQVAPKEEETIDPFRTQPEFLGRLVEQFNDTILKSIFSFCDEPTFATLNLVCKNWRRVTTSFEIWYQSLVDN